MAEHEPCTGGSDDWYTPPDYFSAFGCRFDLDPCSPGIWHWVPAHKVYTKADDGLSKPWAGFVFMNPPFGGRNGLVPWLKNFFEHGDGIALVPDRTSAPWWQEYASKADSILFVSPKLKFIGADGKPGNSPAQGTSLLAAGERAIDALNMAQSRGLGLLCHPSASSLPQAKLDGAA